MVVPNNTPKGGHIGNITPKVSPFYNPTVIGQKMCPEFGILARETQMIAGGPSAMQVMFIRCMKEECAKWDSCPANKKEVKLK